MRRPWTLIAIPLLVACMLPLAGCSGSTDNPKAYDCAQWRALSDTQRSAALKKLVAANYKSTKVTSDRYGKIADRLDKIIDKICAKSRALVPAEVAVNSEKAGLDPEVDAKGEPTMENPVLRRRRCDSGLWAEFEDDQATFTGRCVEQQRCEKGVVRIIDRHTRAFFCQLPKEQCSGDQYAEYRLPTDIRARDAAAYWRTEEGRVTFDDFFVACRSGARCPEGSVHVVLSDDGRAFNCTEQKTIDEQASKPKLQECDVAQYRTDQCAHLVDKSTDPGIQTTGP